MGNNLEQQLWIMKKLCIFSKKSMNKNIYQNHIIPFWGLMLNFLNLFAKLVIFVEFM